MSYYFNKVVNMTFDEAINKVTEELKKEGFGVLTQIDVKKALKKKNIFQKMSNTGSMKNQSKILNLMWTLFSKNIKDSQKRPLKS